MISGYNSWMDGTKRAIANMWEAAAQKKAEKQEISSSNKKMTDLVRLRKS